MEDSVDGEEGQGRHEVGDTGSGGDEERKQRRRPILKASRRVSRKKEFKRLSRTLIPSHYELYIEPDYPECDTYKGITTIKIKVSHK